MSVKGLPLWVNTDVRNELGTGNWLSEAGPVAGLGGNFWTSQLCGRPVDGTMDTYSYLSGYGAGGGGSANGHPGTIWGKWRIDCIPFLRGYVADIGSGFTSPKDIGYRGYGIKYAKLRELGLDNTQVAYTTCPKVGFYFNFHNDRDIYLGVLRFNVNRGEVYSNWVQHAVDGDGGSGRNWDSKDILVDGPTAGEIILPAFRTQSGADSISIYASAPNQGVWRYNITLGYSPQSGPGVSSSSFDGGNSYINGSLYTVEGVSAGINDFKIGISPDPGVGAITVRSLSGTSVRANRTGVINDGHSQIKGVYQVVDNRLFNKVFTIAW